MKAGIGETFLAAGFLLVVVGWSLGIPFNGGPDERTHFFLVEYIHQFGLVPVPHVDPQQPFVGPLTGTVIQREPFWYYGLPYLNALGGAAFAALFADYLPQNMGFLAARAFNWCLAPVFALSLTSIARRCQVGTAEAIAICAVVLLIPQVTFIFSYFNADALALTACSVGVAAFLAVAEKPTRLRAFAFGLACGLILCTKIYYYPSLVFFFFMLLVLRFAHSTFPLSRTFLWSAVGLACVAGPVLTTTYLQFGDVTGLSGQLEFVAGKEKFKRCFFFCNGNLIDAGNVSGWLRISFKSFFAYVGWMNVSVPQPFYDWFYKPLSIGVFAWGATASVPAVRRLAGGNRGAIWLPAIFCLLVAMTVAVVLLTLIGSHRLIPQAQGRYLFVVLPFSFLMLASLAGSPFQPGVARAPGLKRHRMSLTAGFFAVALVMALTNLLAVQALRASLQA